MPREVLTDVRAKKAKPAPAGKRYDLWDALVPGLSLRVTDRGAKAWTVVGRLHGKPLRATLGAYPDLGVQAARGRARTALEALADDRDPRRTRRAELVLMTKALDDYEEMRAAKWGKGYLSNFRSARRLHVDKALGALLVRDVTRRDLSDLLLEIAKQHSGLANSIRGHLSAFFQWALDAGLIEANPATKLRAAEIRTRDRVYSDPELRAIWKQTTAMGYPYGPFIKFQLVTAQRRGQVRNFRREEIDEARGVWTSFTKEKRLHPVPLSPLALEILDAAPKRGAYVFSIEGKRALTNMTYAQRKTKEGEGVPADFRFHDLRRTAATRMAELGVSPWIVDAVLDHVAGGVSAIYQRYSYVDEMRHALTLWSDRLREVISAG